MTKVLVKHDQPIACADLDTLVPGLYERATGERILVWLVAVVGTHLRSFWMYVPNDGYENETTYEVILRGAKSSVLTDAAMERMFGLYWKQVGIFVTREVEF